MQQKKGTHTSIGQITALLLRDLQTARSISSLFSFISIHSSSYNYQENGAGFGNVAEYARVHYAKMH
jgi:hypothetical protein